MIIRQLIDYPSYTYSYLVADENSRQACLIDPVLEQTERNLQLVQEMGLQLILAIDTHVHADHITGLGRLREETGCQTIVGEEGDVACASDSFSDGKILPVGSIEIECLQTPGHTPESVCFLIDDNGRKILFSGDTLLIRGTGRTDFQNGSAKSLHRSLRRLLELPDDTIVYPGHDYNGRTSSTIGEERLHNPRILIADVAQFVEHMANLNLPDPKMMDIAVPANQACGELPPVVKEH